MSVTRRHPSQARVPPESSGNEVYNILPVHNMLADHPALQFPEVRAAASTLKTAGGFRIPPYAQWDSDMDLLDWLGVFFGFQKDNVRNQREHLIVMLANSQMRLQPPPDDIARLEPSVVRKLRKKILKNYDNLCAYLARKSNVLISDRRRASIDERKELLYISLYLLIWGEAANLKFMPECLSYIFHHMAMELNRILEDYLDESTGQPALPAYMGENGFLNRVVTPLYKTVKAEAEASLGGKAHHSAWRNYDDINEYFWSNRCFAQLGWPLKLDSNFFVQSETKPEGGLQRSGGMLQKQKVGKAGFVEQRSFCNIFRSFDRLWIMYILFLQAAIIVAWDGQGLPLVELEKRDIQAKLLSVFITWAGLRLLQSALDADTQYSLVSRETPLQGIRMLLKIIVATVWTILFFVLYSRMWDQRNHDSRWSGDANRRLLNYLEAALAFLSPELLAVLLFFIPWVRNFIEKTNWRIFHVLTWWFQSRMFVGRGLSEGNFDNISYSHFWLNILLLIKFSFSYYLQIEPMVMATKQILKLPESAIHYKWHEFFKHTNQFAIGVLWAPVVLIYFMDTQIWYSILSAMVGALVGLFVHLGEIRNIQQLRLRFQFFAIATHFNLMPQEPLSPTKWYLIVKIRDAIRRLQLRYGFGSYYKKIETNDQVEAVRFALIWNEILRIFWEEDIVNDLEVELLEMPRNSWNERVMQWPCLLLCNELLLALGQATVVGGTDKKLWRKICKNEYRRCAVIETYDNVKHLLHRIVKKDTEEHSIIVSVFEEIEASLETGSLLISPIVKLPG